MINKNWTKLAAQKKKVFDHKLQFTYPQAFIKDVQDDTVEAFSSQKRTSSTSKHEILYKSFLPFWIRVTNPDPGNESGSGLNESGSEKLLNTTPGQKRETDLVECPLPDGGPLGQVQASAGGEGQSKQIEAINSFFTEKSTVARDEYSRTTRVTSLSYTWPGIPNKNFINRALTNPNRHRK